MTKLFSIAASVLVAYSAFGFMNRLYASDVKPDENVVLFPTHANLVENGSDWRVPIHGWIFEPEDDSIWRSALTKTFVRSLGLDEVAVQGDIFRKRVSMFLVDNERKKRLRMRVGNQTIRSEKSRPNGHFFATTKVSPNGLGLEPHACLDISSATYWTRRNL